MFRTKLLPLAAAGALALAAAPAQAYVMASSMVKMTDFVIKGSNGNQLDASDFSFLTFTNSADQSVALTGFATVSNSSASASTPIDFAPICVGAACNPIVPDNTFPKLFAPPATGNYSAADQQEAGAPITGLSGFGSPATVANGSYVGLDTGDVDGSANSNNNLNSSFTFSLTQATGITFEFKVDAYLQAAVQAFPTETFPAFATASYQMDFTITNVSTQDQVWTFAPDLFGGGVKTLSLNAPLPIDVELTKNTGGPKSFSSTTPILEAGTLYQLSARIQTNADAARVPEPATLSILGIGLLGLGASRVRARQSLV